MALSGNLYLAGPHEDQTVRSIQEHFEKLLGEPVNFVVERDERLIGGFRALIDGKLYDSSVTTKMESILHHLKSEG